MTYHFRGDEPGYLRWLALNTSAYVLNLGVPPNPRYLMLHRSTCGDISKPKSVRGPLQFTGGAYTKLCSLNHEAITSWVKENVPGQVSFNRLCQRCEPDAPCDEAAVIRDDFEKRTRKVMSDDDDARRTRLAAKKIRKPDFRYVMTMVFDRDPDVVAEVLARACGKCEGCGALAPFIKKTNGEPYLEVHHIVPLVEHGDDMPENALALCPNCHRQRHYGKKPWRSKIPL